MPGSRSRSPRASTCSAISLPTTMPRIARALPICGAASMWPSRAARRSWAGRSTARRSSLPAGCRRRSRRTQRLRRVERVVRGLQEAGRYAAEHGITLAVEPLNRFETDFCNTARQACALADQVGSPGVGIMLDTFHMNMEDDDLPAAILASQRASRAFPGERESSRLPRHRPSRLVRDLQGAGRRRATRARSRSSRSAAPTTGSRCRSHNGGRPRTDEDADLRRSGDLLRGFLHAAGAR